MKSKLLVSTTVVGLLGLLVMSVRVPGQEESTGQAQKADAARYVVKDLGPVGGPLSEAYLVADSGLVSGAAAYPDGTSHAVVWHRGC